jgi:hypothetical protein
MSGAGAGGVAGAGGDAGSFQSRICQQSGRLPPANPDGTCVSRAELSAHVDSTVLFGVNSAGYSGALPRCVTQASDNGGFAFRFRVDRVDLGTIPSADGGIVAFDTSLVATNLVANPMCGTVVAFQSPSERLSIATGRELSVARRTVPRSDFDVPAAAILYDENKYPLYALVLSARVDLFASDLGDLLPGLKVETATTAVCHAPDVNVDLTSVRLSTATDVCDVDSNSERCCTLWGRTYEVQVHAALAPTATQPYPVVSFALRAGGLVVKAR